MTLSFDFKGKYIIDAELRLTTALHIGGTEEGLEIGGMDNPVIKDPMTGVPFIPGSSLKGKIRNLLEWIVKINQQKETCITAQLNDQNRKKEDLIQKYQTETDPQKKVKLKKRIDQFEFSATPCSCAECEVCVVFGVGAEYHQKGKNPGPTRLTVCDAYPMKTESYDQIEEWETYMGEGIYTEIKTENSIDRLTSAANPRPMERVPAGSVFKVRFIYDVYEDADFDRLKTLFQGMALLEDSTLGGGGSRGSGRVKFENISVIPRHRGYYLGKDDDKPLKEVNLNGFKTAIEFVNRFDEVWVNK